MAEVEVTLKVNGKTVEAKVEPRLLLVISYGSI